MTGDKPEAALPPIYPEADPVHAGMMLLHSIDWIAVNHTDYTLQYQSGLPSPPCPSRRWRLHREHRLDQSFHQSVHT